MNQDLKTIIESVVREELKELELQEGIFDTIKKAAGYANKLAFLQAKNGGGAVKQELLDQLEAFVQKAQGKTTGAGAMMLKDLAIKIQKIQIKQNPDRRYDRSGRQRDQYGRYARNNQEPNTDGYIDDSPTRPRRPR